MGLCERLRNLTDHIILFVDCVWVFVAAGKGTWLMAVCLVNNQLFFLPLCRGGGKPAVAV